MDNMINLKRQMISEAALTDGMVWSMMYHTIQDVFMHHEFNDEADIIEYLDKALPVAKRIPHGVSAIELAIYSARGNNISREKLAEIFSAKKTEHEC